MTSQIRRRAAAVNPLHRPQPDAQGVTPSRTGTPTDPEETRPEPPRPNDYHPSQPNPLHRQPESKHQADPRNPSEGIASMAPGRTMEWLLGAALNTVDWDAHNEYKVRIEAEGPFGPLEAIDFVIILDNLKGSQATAAGNLHAIALQVQELTKATRQVSESVKKTNARTDRDGI
jgi:hypothetical protein